MQLGSAADLIHLLRDSGLFTRDQFRVMVRDVSELGDDLSVVARHLVAADRLTLYQLRKVVHGKTAELFVGPYTLCDKLGEGGMGKVYRARQGPAGRDLAVKVVRAKLLDNPVLRKRYEREVRAASRLQHPNIVSVFDAGQTGDGKCYLAMEFVDGIDLAKVVRDFGRLYVAEACEYVRQAALGLQHLHDSGFVHRDVKPSNVLVCGHRHIPGADGPAYVKILDMGLVRAVGTDDELSKAELSRDGLVVGTPDYMAPEQARNSSLVDHRADVYSLGASLYYLLAAKPPFPDGSPIEKLLKHLTDPPPPIQALRPDVPNALAQLLARLLAKSPADRPQTALELADALRGFCRYTGDPLPDPNKSRLGGASAAPTPSGDTLPSAGVGHSRSLFGDESSVLLESPDPGHGTVPDSPEAERKQRAKVRGPRGRAGAVPPPDDPPTPVSVDHGTPMPARRSERRLPPDPRPAVGPHPRPKPAPGVPARQRRVWPVVAAWLTAAALTGGASWLAVQATLPGDPVPTPPAVAPATPARPASSGRTPGAAPAKLAPLAVRIPDASGLVAVAYPARLLRADPALVRGPTADKLHARLARLAAGTGFDPNRAERVVFAVPGENPNRFVLVAEGPVFDAAFAERLVRTLRPHVAGGKVFRATGPDGGWLPFVTAPVPGVFAAGDDPELLARFVARTALGRPAVGLDAGLTDGLSAADDPDAVAVLSAVGRMPLPGGPSLADLGVDGLSVAVAGGRRLEADLMLTGPDHRKLAAFVPRAANAVRAWHAGFGPVADAFEKGRRTPMIAGDAHHLLVNAVWTPDELSYWLELLLGG